MATYTIEAPDKRRVTFEWNGSAPPTDADMEEVFKAVPSQVPAEKIPQTPAWAGKYPNLYGVAGAARETLAPIVEGVAMAGGALAGAPSGPMGAVAGAGLGYAGANKLVEMADVALGNKVEAPLAQQVQELPSQIATGMGMEAGGQVVGKAVTSVAKKGATLAEDVIARQKLSKETGVDLSPASIKGEKALMQVESLLNKNIGSSTKAQAAYEKTQGQIALYAKKLQDAMGGKITAEEAGEKVQAYAKNRYGQFMAKAQKLYDGVPVDKDTFIETDNLRDVAIGIQDEIGRMGTPVSKRILQIAEASMQPNTLKYTPGAPELTANMGAGPTFDTPLNIGRGRSITLDAAKTTFSPEKGLVDASGNFFSGQKMPTYTWKELTADRAALNAMWRTTADPNRKRLIGMMVDAIDDDIAAFSKISPDVDAAFKKATEFYKFGDESVPGVRTFRNRQIKNMLETNSTEKIVDKFIRPNNVSSIKQLVSASGDGGKAEIKKAWLDRMVTSGEEHSFSPAKFSTALEKYDDVDLGAFLSKEEISGLKNLARVSRVSLKTEKLAGNPSGTAQNNITAGTVVGFIYHPVITTATLLGSNKFASLYFENPEFRKTLVEGIKFPANTLQAKLLAKRLDAIIKSVGVVELQDR